MKKSKIIIPALAMVAFSMAASITGAVAWFTANRVATITAGEFAVVNTTSDLQVSLTGGVGTSIDQTNSPREVNVTDGYVLTDGSLDHASTDHNIVAPDITGNYAGKSTALANVGVNNPLLRDATNNVYTAFTWDMTFTVSFAGSASFDLGLFMDLSSSESYMHRKVSYKVGDTPNNVSHFSDAACTTAAQIATDNEGKVSTAITVYEEAPIETGKAFRIAFIPTAIGGSGTNTSIGYSKVWAKNETSTHCGYINTEAQGFLTEETADPSAQTPTYPTALNAAGVDVDYSTATSKLSGNGTSSAASGETLSASKVLMDSQIQDAIPGNNTLSASQALSQKANYLGLFKLDAGKTVELTFTCVAWFDGTDVSAQGGHIVSNATEFETIVSSMKFGVSNLNA